MLTRIKLGVSLYVSNVAQEVIFFDWMFSLQHLCDCLVDRDRTVLSKLVWLENSPLFLVTDESYGFVKSYFQDKIRERPMTLLLNLIPARFSEASHSLIVRVFQNLVKCPTIPASKSKQYMLDNLRRIINVLGVFWANDYHDKPFDIKIYVARDQMVKLYY